MTLLERLIRRKTRCEPLALRVYTRADCCCCHKALELLARYKRKGLVAIEEVRIDGDPELEARHGQWVPVVEVAGKVRFRGVVSPVLLDRLLLAEGLRR